MRLGQHLGLEQLPGPVERHPLRVRQVFLRHNISGRTGLRLKMLLMILTCHTQGLYSFGRSRNVCALSAKLGMNCDKCVMYPMKECSCSLVCCVGILTMSLIFSGSGLMP